MATGKEIKSRIKSIQNTKKITKAMELVAASKMKRIVEATLASRAYAHYAQEILRAVSEVKPENNDIIPEILRVPTQIKKVLLVLITSNRGLCGSYNTQVIKKIITEIKKYDPSNTLSFISVGKKGDLALKRMGMNIIASFSDFPENISLYDIGSLAELIIEKYKSGDVDKILIAYTDFKSALSQIANIRQLLPIYTNDLKQVVESLEDIKNDNNQSKKIINEKYKNEYVFEPGYDKLMKILVWKLIRMQIYQILLESNASEQSSRMMAMKNASESASDIIDNLTLEFNKARQASITQEISEISGGMAVMTS